MAGSLEAECEAFEAVGLERIRGTGGESANVGIEVVDTADAVTYYFFQAVTTEDRLSASGQGKGLFANAHGDLEGVGACFCVKGLGGAA